MIFTAVPPKAPMEFTTYDIYTWHREKSIVVPGSLLLLSLCPSSDVTYKTTIGTSQLRDAVWANDDGDPEPFLRLDELNIDPIKNYIIVFVSDKDRRLMAIPTHYRHVTQMVNLADLLNAICASHDVSGKIDLSQDMAKGLVAEIRYYCRHLKPIEVADSGVSYLIGWCTLPGSISIDEICDTLLCVEATKRDEDSELQINSVRFYIKPVVRCLNLRFMYGRRSPDINNITTRIGWEYIREDVPHTFYLTDALADKIDEHVFWG